MRGWKALTTARSALISASQAKLGDAAVQREILMVENPDNRADEREGRAEQVREAAGVAIGSPQSRDISNNGTPLCLTQADPLSCRML